MMKDLPEVKPGQIWQDNDKRSRNRFLLVLRLDGEKAICQDAILLSEAGSYRVIGNRERRISIARMRPTSNGYRLVKAA